MIDKDIYENLCVLSEQLPVDYRELFARTIRSISQSDHDEAVYRWLRDAGYTERREAR